MASIAEIKKELTNAFISDPEVKTKYGLVEGKTFEDQFSKVSLESIFFYAFAVCVWTLRMLFDKHKSDVETELDNRLTGRPNWYRDKVLKFQYPNRNVIYDTDRYDNTGLSDADIEALQVVKYCVTEPKAARLLIKVAKGAPGNRQVLADDELLGLMAYMENHVNYAGVALSFVNQQADRFFCKVICYYNPMLLNPADKPVEKAIKSYVSNLEFNSEYSNMALTDYLQAIPGVKIPHLSEVKTQRADNTPEACVIRTFPESGYFKVEKDSDVQVTYIPTNDTSAIVQQVTEYGVINDTNTQSDG